MSNGRESHRRSRIVAMLTTLCLVGVAAGFIGGCAQKPVEPTKAASVKKDGDVHIKVDLPDTVTIK